MSDEENIPPNDLAPFTDDVLLSVLPLLSSADVTCVARLNSSFHSVVIPFLYKSVTLGGIRQGVFPLRLKDHSITHTVDFLRRHPAVADKIAALRLDVHPRCHDVIAECSKESPGPAHTVHSHYLPRLRNLERLEVVWDYDWSYSNCPFVEISTANDTPSHLDHPANPPDLSDIPFAAYLSNLVDNRKLLQLVLRTANPPIGRSFPYLGLIQLAKLTRLERLVVVTNFREYLDEHSLHMEWPPKYSTYDGSLNQTPLQLVLICVIDGFAQKMMGKWGWDTVYEGLVEQLAEWFAILPSTIRATIVNLHWAILQVFSSEEESEHYFRAKVADEMSFRRMSKEQMEERQATMRIISLAEYCEEMGDEAELDEGLEWHLGWQQRNPYYKRS